MSGLQPEECRQLRRLLEEHVPADAKERRDRERIVDFVEREANPFDRRLPHAHLTGSAFVIDPAGRILLSWHRRLDLWVQLGGHAEEERDAAAVARREATEESGLDDLRFVEALRFADGRPRLLHLDVHSIPARGREPEHDHLDLRFLLRTERPEAAAHDPAESRELAWLAPEAACERGDGSVARAVARIQLLSGGRSSPSFPGGT